MKTCLICKHQKSITEFCTDARGRVKSYCNPCNRQRSRDWWDANREEANPRRYAKKYGITPEEYLAKQRDTCFVCGGEPDGRWKKLNLDHCHATGAVGEMLCGACNKALGLVGDSPSTLRKLADYLESYR